MSDNIERKTNKCKNSQYCTWFRLDSGTMSHMTHNKHICENLI